MGGIVNWIAGLPGMSGFTDWVTGFPLWVLFVFVWGFPVLMLGVGWLVFLRATGTPATLSPPASERAEPVKVPATLPAMPLPDEMDTGNFPVPVDLLPRKDRDWERTSRAHLWVGNGRKVSPNAKRG